MLELEQSKRQQGRDSAQFSRLQAGLSGFSESPDGEVAFRSRYKVFAKASNFEMVYVSKARCRNIVDIIAKDVVKTLNYWSASIAEVKSVPYWMIG